MGLTFGFQWVAVPYERSAYSSGGRSGHFWSQFDQMIIGSNGAVNAWMKAHISREIGDKSDVLLFKSQYIFVELNIVRKVRQNICLSVEFSSNIRRLFRRLYSRSLRRLTRLWKTLQDMCVFGRSVSKFTICQAFASNDSNETNIV